MIRVPGFRRRLGRRLGKIQLQLAVNQRCRGNWQHSDRRFRLGIGPLNTAGQAQAWAQAVRRYESPTDAESFGPRRGSVLEFDCDRTFTIGHWLSRPWQITNNVPYVLSRYTHLLLESGWSVFGRLSGGLFDDDLPHLEHCGIAAGIVLHGSDIRDPDDNAAIEPFSPFRTGPADTEDPSWVQRVDKLRRKTAELRTRLDANPAVHKFVSTPGLLDYVPEAEWLPVVVDTAPTVGKSLLRDALPIVLHGPTNPRMKGTHFIDPVCKNLEQAGLVDYVSPDLVSPDRFASLLAQASIVIDAISLGDGPSVTACQAMAAGAVVVGHISDTVRARIPTALPIVEATPKTLEAVVTRLLSNPRELAEISILSRRYVEEYHSGRYSAELLMRFIEQA